MQIQQLHTLVLSWFKEYGREFLWRSEHPDPYIVLLSEIMLQQTQTSRIAIKLPEFLEQYPTIESLSKATNAEIIIAWQGMGYNNRALRLRDCAKVIVEQKQGIIPDTFSDLIKLPGIGIYTASAVCSFAFGKDISVVDINIHRIYSRLMGYRDQRELTLKKAIEIADEYYPRGNSSAWHQALMDIGATLCKAHNPQCSACPLQEPCAYSKMSLQENTVQIIKKSKKQEPSHKGIPNRIWRGKLVECLRNAPNNGVEITEALRLIVQYDIKEKDMAWFEKVIVSGLVKDSIICYDEKKKRIQFDNT